MNSGQIERALGTDRDTKHNFRGVFARDELPPELEEGFYVVNFDKKGEPGSHWVCIEKEQDGSLTYFDSYGQKPPFFSDFKRLWGKKERVKRNTKQLQHNYSTTCGQWCMYFIWRRCNKWGLRNIISPFRKATPLVNDHVMNYLVGKKFGTRKKVIDRPFLKQQMCKAMEENLADWPSLYYNSD